MECAPIIEQKINKISEVLENKYGLTLQVQRTLEYCVKYIVFNQGKECGVINCFYSPKKQHFTITKEKGDETVVKFASYIRYEIENEKGNVIKSEKEVKIEELKYYYEALKPYADRNISFEVFGEKLKEYIERYKSEYCVCAEADFRELENIYKKLI